MCEGGVVMWVCACVGMWGSDVCRWVCGEAGWLI